jgi:hypothetical protein
MPGNDGSACCFPRIAGTHHAFPDYGSGGQWASGARAARVHQHAAHPLCCTAVAAASTLAASRGLAPHATCHPPMSAPPPIPPPPPPPTPPHPHPPDPPPPPPPPPHTHRLLHPQRPGGHGGAAAAPGQGAAGADPGPGRAPGVGGVGGPGAGQRRAAVQGCHSHALLHG